MENNVQEDYKSEILDIVRSNASPGIMRDKLEDYHENDLAEVFPELTLTERRKVYRILVNSIQVEVTLAHILAFLIAIIISLYNVLAADCLPVQIGVNYEK